MSQDTIADETLQPQVAAGYLALADLLEKIPAADWERPSLCADWRIREVVAHVTMPARYDEAAFMAELQARDFDFGRLSNDIASRDAGRPAAELLADLRSEVLQHWTPPGGGYRGALNHVVIHGLDITVALGAARGPSDETMGWILRDLTEGGTHQHFGVSISGRRFEASDLSWSYGSGDLVRGPAAELAVLLCGRTVPRPE